MVGFKRRRAGNGRRPVAYGSMRLEERTAEYLPAVPRIGRALAFHCKKKGLFQLKVLLCQKIYIQK